MGQLNVNSVALSGNLSGTLFIPGIVAGLSPFNIQGLWDEASQEITFNVIVSEVPQVYTAFLFQDQSRITTGVTGSVVFTLAGYFQMFGGVVGLAITA